MCNFGNICNMVMNNFREGVYDIRSDRYSNSTSVSNTIEFSITINVDYEDEED